MRFKRYLAFLILGCSIVIIVPAITIGQFQPGGGGGGKKKGGGMGGFNRGDPSQVFDLYAQGASSINIANVKWGKDEMLQYAKDHNITNGQLTRAQFIDFQEQKTAKMAAMGGGKGNKGGGFPGNGGGFQFPSGGPGKKFGNDGGGGLPPAIMQAPQGIDINQFADLEFKRRDANGDGKLNDQEMPRPLKFNLAKWDKNGDGLIDLAEFREYFASQLMGGGNDDNSRGSTSIIIDEDELDRKPVVFRVGTKLPAGLPKWFKELDTDQDGQVALYEWRKAGKVLDDFKQWDLNDDGFITMEEAIKCQAALKTDAKTTDGSLASNGGTSGTDRKMAFDGKKKGPPSDGSSDGGKGRFGGFGGGGKGKKGGQQQQQP